MRKSVFRPARWLLSLLAGTVILLAAGSAAAEVRLRDRMIISYRVAPAQRPALRTYFLGPGAQIFERAKSDGKIADYKILLSLYPNSDAIFDAAVVLDFDKAEDMAHWQAIEHETPGGLSAPGLALVTSIDIDVLDQLLDMAPQSKFGISNNNVFVVAPHTMPNANLGKYRQFSREYLLPVIEAYMRDGALDSFSLYMNAYPAGAKWQALLVFGFTDLAQLEKRENIQAKVREGLLANPVWKGWFDQRYTLRSEMRSILATQVVRPVLKK